MYVIKDTITNKYWSGAEEGESEFYDALQNAYTFHEKDLFDPRENEEIVEVEYVLKEVH